MDELIAGALFLSTYAIILSERVHRTIIGLFGAVVMVGVGIARGFYTQEQAIEAIDFNTLGLLLGMMLLTGMLKQTGFFGYLAIYVAKRTRGSPLRLLLLLGTITTVLSLFLDNVTTIVLMAPITVTITNLLGINPVPILMAEALLSNTGGTATLVGDPPNIMIGSAGNLSFNDFLTHLAPIVLVAWLLTLLLLRFIFRRTLAQRPQNVEALMEMNEREALTDVAALRKVLIALGLVIALFFVHDRLHLLPSFATMLGAALALLWVRPNPEEILNEVDWSVLLFFASLFILVGGLEHVGILNRVAEAITAFASENLLLTAIMILWISAVASAIVDNIPFTIAMIPIIQHLETQGINITPLWWSLALGAGFGGNGTPIGSTANVVAVSISERTDTPITTAIWLRSGTLVMLLTCAVSTVLLSVFFAWYQ